MKRLLFSFLCITFIFSCRKVVQPDVATDRVKDRNKYIPDIIGNNTFLHIYHFQGGGVIRHDTLNDTLISIHQVNDSTIRVFDREMVRLLEDYPRYAAIQADTENTHTYYDKEGTQEHYGFAAIYYFKLDSLVIRRWSGGRGGGSMHTYIRQ